MLGVKGCRNCKSSKRGICRTHLKELLDKYIMKCDNCPISEVCPLSNQNPEHLCILELDTVDWNKKSEIEYLMQRFLELERKILMRKGISADRLNNDAEKAAFQKGLDMFMEHLDRYSRFRGWTGKSIGMESEEKRLRTIKFLKSIFVRPSQLPKEKKEIQEIETSRT